MSPVRTSRRELLKGLGALGLGASTLGLGGRPGKRERKPNVLFLMPDQLRRQSTSFHGDRVVRMPRIQALAEESLIFERAISTNPVCSAYRTMMLTGQYTHLSGNKLRPEVENLYRVLGRQGWDIAHIGKWHMTPKELETEDESVPAEVRGDVDFAALYEVNHNYRFGTYFLNDDPKPRRAQSWRPDNLTQLATDYLSSRGPDDPPFFLTLALGPPHNPYAPRRRYDTFRPEEVQLRDNVPTRFRRRSRSTQALYYGLISNVDENIGRVLDALEASGQAQDTLVVFTSDHGDMLWSQGEEYKRRPWEESIGVPFLIRPCRGVELELGRRQRLFPTVDLMPSLLDLLGVAAPAGLQGESVFSPEPRQAAYIEETSAKRTPFGAHWRGVVTDDGWKYATSRGREQWLLYDLNEDPLERNNLIEDEKHATRRSELEQLARELAGKSGDDYFAS